MRTFLGPRGSDKYHSLENEADREALQSYVNIVYDDPTIHL